MSVNQNKGFNIFDFLQKARPFLLELRKKWYVLVLLGIVFGCIGYYTESKKPTIYSAQITYMLEDEILGSGQANANPLMAAISGQGAPASSKAVMNDLTMSNKLIEMTLLSQAEIENRKILLVNYYQEFSGYLEKNNTKDPFWYRDTYNIGQNQALDTRLRSLSSILKLSLKAKVMESGLLKMDLSSEDEKFTKFFLEQHLKTISDFYINKRIEKAQLAVNSIKRRKDSLNAVIQGKEFAAAAILDNSFGAVMRRAQVPEVQVRKDITILNNQYVESINALTGARAELEKRRPFIAIVDDVRYPLNSVAPKVITQGLISFVIGIVIGLFLLVGKDFGGDYIKKQKQVFNQTIKTSD